MLRSSPFLKQGHNTQLMMLRVIFACIPAIVAMTMLYGWGVLVNLLLACFSGLLFEALFLAARGRSIRHGLSDFSALLTAVLLALAIPAYAPWWIPVVGMFFAIVVAKQLYGGLGLNPFNPAMVGYVVLLISFPVHMTAWTTPSALSVLPDNSALLAHIFNGTSLDSYTSATVLDVLKNNTKLTNDELYAATPLLNKGIIAGYGTDIINIAFLIGGLFLLKKRVFRWHAPIAFLGAITLLSLVFWGGDSSQGHGSPLFHLFSGATMFGAFFIITDPVSGCTSNKGRLVFGALVGSLVYIIRVWGNYPDAVAFAVLLGNLCAPFIDYYTTPRTYGHNKAKAVIGGDNK